MLKILNNKELEIFIKNENIKSSDKIFNIILDLDNNRYIINGNIIVNSKKEILQKYI